MSNPWFRMYHEFATDPKVQMLSETDQRRYIMLLCLRCSNGDVTLHETEVAFQLRISNEEYVNTKRILIEKGLLDEDNKPTAWDRRQFKTDSSAERVAKHRAKKKQELASQSGIGNDTNKKCNVTGNGDETKSNALDTDTDTDTDKKKKDKKENLIPKKTKKIFHPPNEIDPVLWAKYLVSRKEKKHPMNADALELVSNAILKTHAAGHPIPNILTYMIEAGWRTVKPDWIINLEGENNAGNNIGNQHRADGIDWDQPFDLDQWDDFTREHGEGEGTGNQVGSALEGSFSRMEASHS